MKICRIPRVWRGWPGMFLLLALVWGSPARPQDSGNPNAVVVPDLNAAAEFSGQAVSELAGIIRNGTPSPGDADGFGRPALGSLVGRWTIEESEKLSKLINSQGGIAALPVPTLPAGMRRDLLPMPPVFTVVLWTRISPDRPSRILLGVGPRDGDYLTIASDREGAPVFVATRPDGINQAGRAERGATNLADNKLHSIVVVVDMNAGLARMYVDGQPEVARKFSLWRCGNLGQAFGYWLAASRSGGNEHALFLPRIITGELSEMEIAEMKPGTHDAHAPEEFPNLSDRLVLRLLKDSLVEFLPLSYGYCIPPRVPPFQKISLAHDPKVPES